jgi:hypothetical protein
VIFQVVDRMRCFPIAHSSSISIKVENSLPVLRSLYSVLEKHATISIR